MIETIWGWMNDLHVQSIAIVLQSCLGIAGSAYMLRQRALGLEAMREAGVNGAGKHVTWEDIRTEASFLICFALYLVLGLAATIFAFASPPFGAVETWVLTNGGYVLNQVVLSVLTVMLVGMVVRYFGWRRLMKMMGVYE